MINWCQCARWVSECVCDIQTNIIIVPIWGGSKEQDCCGMQQALWKLERLQSMPQWSVELLFIGFKILNNKTLSKCCAQKKSHLLKLDANPTIDRVECVYSNVRRQHNRHTPNRPPDAAVVLVHTTWPTIAIENLLATLARLTKAIRY